MTVNFGTMGMYPSSLDTEAIMNAPLMSSGISTNGLYTGTMGMTGMISPLGGYSGLGNFGGILMNPQQQMQNIQQWDNFNMSRQVDAFKNQNTAQFRMQAQNGSIERQVRILAQEIKADNQDNIKAEYNKLLQAVKSAYGSNLQGTEEEKELTLKQYADNIYAQMTGTYMTDDIKANSSSGFMAGIKRSLSFGFSNKTTADENIAMITGAKQTTGSKASHIAGRVIGGVVNLVGGIVSLFH